jgi:long-chain acyl-CoA synthetase
MSFLTDIFDALENSPSATVLQEIHDGRITAHVTGRGFLEYVARARAFLAAQQMSRGDRVALLAHNGIRWAALDLAIMAEGLVAVPLYARQDAGELVVIMKDCAPRLICAGDAVLCEDVRHAWADAPPVCLFDEAFGTKHGVETRPSLASADAVTLIYTSGTSGDSKGVVLTAGNVTHMLGCTSGRLDLLMDRSPEQHRVFQYLPFCFAGSWILLLTALRRASLLTLNTDLTKIANDMRVVAPDYFLNVPALLERMRKGIDEQLWQAGGFVQTIYAKAKGAWSRKMEGTMGFADRVWLSLANSAIFPTIRKKMIGRNLQALICGSAPLSIDTQQFFMMLGIPVLQVYGLTETTAICSMDDPRQVTPGRVGPAIDGVEMRLGENEEILVRGPNIFPGYWNRPAETAKALRDGWFHTGDQGEADATGNWKIVGRLKNLIILGSGHNIAPEPIEDKLLQQLPSASQVVLTGNGKGFLSAIITGKVTDQAAQAAIDAVNSQLPHYKQIRAFYLRPEPFTIESGLLTANGKLRRDMISSTLSREIEDMYRVKAAV